MPPLATGTSSGLSAEDEYKFPTPTPTPLPVNRDHGVDVFGDSILGDLWVAACQRIVSAEAVASLANKIQASLVECGDAVRVLLRSATGAVEVAVQALSIDVPEARPSPEPATIEPAHTRLARELRELTGLPASALGSALGVTREQYQRWLSGGAISDVRHGQLVYLHTIAADVHRRLGPPATTLWWRTPTPSGPTPADLVARRQADTVYRLAASISDPAPVVDGVIVGLPMQRNLPDDFGGDASDDGEAWSPYRDTRPGS